MPDEQPYKPNLLLKLATLAVILGVMAWLRSREDPNAPPALPKSGAEVADNRDANKSADAKRADKSAEKSDRAKADKSSDDESPVGSKRYRVPDITVKNLDGDVVYTGTVDLTSTVERIHDNRILDRFRDDGIVFQNRERRLPQQNAGYYHEYVHPTPGLKGPGPQRIVAGRDGDLWYTWDHYEHFKKLD